MIVVATGAVSFVVVIAVLAVLVSHGHRRDAVPQVAQAAPALSPGTPAPPFSLARLGGGRAVTLADYRGSTVVLNFFSSWCSTCRSELRDLAALARRDAGNVAVIGIDTDDGDPAAARHLLAEAHASYPVGVDSYSALGMRFGLENLPATYVIDPEGRVEGSWLGPMTADELRHLLSAGSSGSAR